MNFFVNGVFKVSVKKFYPIDRKIKKSVILLAAIGVEISKYQKFIDELLKFGYLVVTADYPGYADNEPKPSKGVSYNYIDLINVFLPELVKTLPQADQKNPIFIGHSLGGQLATFYTLQQKAQVIGVATATPYYNNYTFWWKIKILFASILFKRVIEFKGYFPGKKFKFGRREAYGLIEQWIEIATHDHAKKILGEKKVSDYNNFFINIKGDEWAPRKGAEHLASYFSKPVVETIEVPDDVTGNLHSTWLRSPKFIADKVDIIITQWSG